MYGKLVLKRDTGRVKRRAVEDWVGTKGRKLYIG